MLVLMAKISILVLADADDPQLKMLEDLRPIADVVIGDSVADFAVALLNARVVFHWSAPAGLLRELVQSCPKLEWVHSRSAGLEKTLFRELVESSIRVTNGSGVFSQSLGEFVLAAILYFAKDFRRMIRSQTASKWDPFDITMISGCTVGIVGYGDIGRAIASRLRPMGMRILALKRHVSASAKDPLVDQVYPPARRVEMLSLCDYIALAAPLTPETQGMLGDAEFAAMKPNAVVINVGRGPVIDEKTLVKALSSGRIRGAALDVFDHEPLPPGHAFYQLENVLLSPHCADHTPDWLDDAMKFFIEQVNRLHRGEALKNVVDKKLGY